MEFTILPDVSILILNWNNWQSTSETLKSVLSSSYPNYSVTLLDNGSCDNSYEILSSLFPQIKIIKCKENMGFAEGVNIGIKEILKCKETNYILLLNNDVVIEKDMITHMINAAFLDEKIGIVGAKVYQYSNPTLLYGTWGTINFRQYVSKIEGENSKDIEKFNKIREVDYVLGCCILIKKNLLDDIGLFDSKYFAYHEELDFCVRAKKKGYKIIFTPKAYLFHKGSYSLKGEFKYKVRNYFLGRNSFLFVKKHGSKRNYIKFFLFVILDIIFKFPSLFFYNLRIRYLARIKGYFDGFLDRKIDQEIKNYLKGTR